jgi:MoxR-like ATPase
MHGTSKHFLFIALQASESNSKLAFHLVSLSHKIYTDSCLLIHNLQNDMFAISHHHTEDDGFPNLEEQQFEEPPQSNDAASISSVVKHSFPNKEALSESPTITPEEIQDLRAAVKTVRVSAEVAAYLHNIVIFMRLNRFVAGGVSAYATRHFRTIVHALAPLHGLTYVPPSLVDLAARKVYAHRLILATTNTERSMQWGSDFRAVEQILKDVTVADAIESVLSSVEAPL